MKKSDKSTGKVKTKKRGFKSIVAATLFITVAFAALIYLTYLFNVVSIFDISSLLKEKKTPSAILDNGDLLYDNLIDENGLKSYKMLYKITPEELTSILASFETKVMYNIEAQTVNYGSAATKLTRVVAERDGDVFTVNKYIDNKLVENIVSDGSYVTYTDKTRSRSTKHVLGTIFDFESCCNMPSLDDLKAICNDVLNGSDSVSDYDISLISSNGKSLYKASFTYADISQREEYYVSADTEMIVNAYSYINDNLYYRYTLVSFDEAK